MAIRNRASFVRMCRTFPLRTALFTLGPVAIGIAQIWNAALHDSNLWGVTAVAAVMVVFSVLVTNYHLASFRRQTLTREFP